MELTVKSVTPFAGAKAAPLLPVSSCMALCGELIEQATEGAMKVKELIARLQAEGWYLARTRGSHRQFKHPDKPGVVTVSGKPSIEMPPGTLNAILKHAGLKS